MFKNALPPQALDPKNGYKTVAVHSRIVSTLEVFVLRHFALGSLREVSLIRLRACIHTDLAVSFFCAHFGFVHVLFNKRCHWLLLFVVAAHRKQKFSVCHISLWLLSVRYLWRCISVSFLSVNLITQIRDIPRDVCKHFLPVGFLHTLRASEGPTVSFSTRNVFIFLFYV